MEVTYGITIAEENDPYVTAVQEALDGLSEAGPFGAFLVDVLPIMKYIPSWFPGTQWKKKAEQWKRANDSVQYDPFRFVKDQMVRLFFAPLRPPSLTFRCSKGGWHDLASQQRPFRIYQTKDLRIGQRRRNLFVTHVQSPSLASFPLIITTIYPSDPLLGGADTV